MSATQPSDLFPFGVSGQNSIIGSGSGSGSASRPFHQTIISYIEKVLFPYEGGDLCILEGDSCDMNADFHTTNCTCMCKIGFDGDGLYCISKYLLPMESNAWI